MMATSGSVLDPDHRLPLVGLSNAQEEVVAAIQIAVRREVQSAVAKEVEA